MRCPMSLVRRLWPAFAMLIAIAPSASAQTTEAVDAVTAALRARNFTQAVERSQAALARAPNDARLWTLNGLALAALSRRAEALRSFQRALTIDPNYLAALEGAAQAHYEAGSNADGDNLDYPDVSDVASFKKTALGKGVDVQVRFEFYNIFNRPNLYLSNDLSSPGFGKAISRQLPRWWQFGARLTF